MNLVVMGLNPDGPPVVLATTSAIRASIGVAHAIASGLPWHPGYAEEMARQHRLHQRRPDLPVEEPARWRRMMMEAAHREWERIKERRKNARGWGVEERRSDDAWESHRPSGQGPEDLARRGGPDHVPDGTGQ
jgi:hypothetical protein